MTHFIRAPLNLLWLTGPGFHLELKRVNALVCLQVFFSAEKSDWSNYDQSTDYSFVAGANNYILAQRIGLYYNKGTLIGGSEPA